jgi:hypothetical protein
MDRRWCTYVPPVVLTSGRRLGANWLESTYKSKSALTATEHLSGIANIYICRQNSMDPGE